jgi:hypothetical protein
MMKALVCFLILTVAVLAVSAAPPSAVEMRSPAALGSQAPNLSIAPDGRLLLSWLEPISPKGYALKFSLRENQQWSVPHTITSGTDWFVSDADYPTVAFMQDGTMAANSLIATNLDREAHNTNVFLSQDGGKTWSKPVPIHRDKKIRQHGFVSFVPAPDGRLGAVWLDGRQLSNSNEGDMALLYTTIGKDGSIRGETTLDSRVCECCQTSTVATPDALLVAYRDRSSREVRDISVVRLVNGKWSAPVLVSKDDWMIDACPVNGPAIAAKGNTVTVAWLTVVNDKSRVNVAFSSDAGKSFGKPIIVDDNNPQGHVDVVSLESGGAVVSWVGRANQKNEVLIRQIESNGPSGNAQPISTGIGVSNGSFPRIQRSGNDLFVAWTSPGDRPAVHTAVVNLKPVQ